MLDDVLPTEARDEVTALRFTCIETRTGREVDGQTEAEVADHVKTQRA